MPHRTVDPIAVGAQLVTALQTIVSRSLDPLESGVVSVTALHAGDTWNVVPDSATLRGSVRAFDEAVQSLIEQRLRELVAGIAASFGAATTIRYERRYPPTINWVVETEHASQAAHSAFGESAVRTAARPLMASEDFAYMLREKPGCFALIGNGSAEGSCELHNPHYDFNDDLLAPGAAYWVTLVEERLAPAGAP